MTTTAPPSEATATATDVRRWRPLLWFGLAAVIVGLMVVIALLAAGRAPVQYDATISKLSSGRSTVCVVRDGEQLADQVCGYLIVVPQDAPRIAEGASVVVTETDLEAPGVVYDGLLLTPEGPAGLS